MHCPFCRNTDTRVLDSRVADDGGSIRRRRTCPSCEKRFTTVEQMQLTVVKRSGATEPFSRDKAIAGVRKACKGRPVTEDDLACLGQQVEDALRGAGWAEVARPRGRPGDPRRRCASSTRSPTSGSPASTAPSSRADDFEAEIARAAAPSERRPTSSSSPASARSGLTTDRPARTWGSGAPGAPARSRESRSTQHDEPAPRDETDEGEEHDRDGQRHRPRASAQRTARA